MTASRRHLLVVAASSLAAALLFWGCSDTAEIAPDSGAPNHCPAGLKPAGAACIPDFDTCQADEVPLAGGGCKRVGVRECPGGLAGPPDWTCKPIGPPKPCLKGWIPVKGGWCEPVLPAASCATGEMEVLGQSACRPVGDCGSGTWGNIITTASTIHVDKNHTGTGGQGTKTEPYKTIAEAILATTNLHNTDSGRDTMPTGQTAG